MPNNVCDILIPIYNAFDDVVECIDSIAANTDNTKYRLILINDKSTDERIEIYLKELEKKKITNLTILRNERNLGFVQTINIGIQLSTNDVVLLNSDTIVTNNWLNKIVACAYAHDSIATVTPLTNSGAICSIPEFNEENLIPENTTVEQYAKMIEKTSLKRYPIIPTAVGFCMFIKRSIVNEIGILDAESFNKGYGEENDFSCKAREYGYVNVLCDDTFILHKGSMSFKEDKRKYIEQNLKILGERYPYYHGEIQRFIEKNPLKDIQDNIKMHIKLHNNKRNILYILHNGILKDINHPRGGTEFHVLDLVENIKDYNKYVLSISGRNVFLNAFTDNNILEFKYELQDEVSENSFESSGYENLIKQIISTFDIDLIHVQHYKCHIANLPKVAKEMNIPITITLHDFYSLCPTINLLDINGKYCEKTRNDEMCKKCIKNKFGYNTNFIKIWNDRMIIILQGYDEIFVPSESAKEIINKYYKNFKLNIKVIEHGIDEKVMVEEYDLKKEKFNIAFLGGLAPYKGSGIIHDLITKNKEKDIDWFLIGNLGDQRLNLLERKDLIKYGRYDRDNVVKILKELHIDMICILSIWPETYSYTLSEAWQAGIPVLTTDLGAPGERVNKSGAGWTFAAESNPEQILKLIYQIKNDKTDFNLKLENTKNIKLKTKMQMANEYVEIYSKLFRKQKINLQVDAVGAFNSYRRANISGANLNSEQTMELFNKIQSLEVEINRMRSTIGWKLLNKLREKNPKIIKWMKKIVYFFARKGYN